MVKEVKQGMADCGHLKGDLKKLETMISTYKTLPSFAWHVGKDLLLNGKDIYAEINSGISDYKAGNWENFGKDIGQASAKIFIGAKEEHFNDDQQGGKMAKFFQGFAKANGFTFNLMNLLDCIY